MYILINHRIATNACGSHCLKNRVESYIIFTLHAGNVRLRCRETHQKRVNSVNHAFIERAVASWRQRLRACVRAGDRHFEHTM